MEIRGSLSVSERCKRATDSTIRCWLRAHKCLRPHSVLVTTSGAKKMRRSVNQRDRQSAALPIRAGRLTRRFGTRTCCRSKVKAEPHSGYAKQEFPSTTKPGTQIAAHFKAKMAKPSRPWREKLSVLTRVRLSLVMSLH